MTEGSYLKDNSLMPIDDTQAEIFAQPIVLAEVLSKCSAVVRALAIDLVRRRIRDLFIIGSGDSWFAGLACRLAFERYAGLPTEAFQAFEYAAYGRPHSNDQTVAIVISSSGRPTTTWDALDRVLATPAYAVGITDNPYPGNPFSERVHTALVPGASKIGWPTQTTTATIAILLDLAIEIGRGYQTLSTTEADIISNRLRAIPSLMQNFIDDYCAVIKAIACRHAQERSPTHLYIGRCRAKFRCGPQWYGLTRRGATRGGYRNRGGRISPWSAYSDDRF